MRKSSGPQWAIRVLLYIIGLLFLAFGVAISANSNLGGAESYPLLIGKGSKV